MRTQGPMEQGPGDSGWDSGGGWPKYRQHGLQILKEHSKKASWLYNFFMQDLWKSMNNNSTM